MTPVLAPVPVGAPGMLIVDPQHDDEPMPIPSTWRQPMLSDDDRWYRQQLGAAALGLIAGLIVVVPAVLWLSGFLGGPQKGPRPAVAETPPAVKIAEVKRVKADTPPKVDPPAPVERAAPAPRPETRTASALPLPTKAAPPPPPKVEPVRSRTEELLKQAKFRIESGDIKGAREILDAPETASSGAMIFMLAETYDPNMLAIWDKGARKIAPILTRRGTSTRRRSPWARPGPSRGCGPTGWAPTRPPPAPRRAEDRWHLRLPLVAGATRAGYPCRHSDGRGCSVRAWPIFSSATRGPIGRGWGRSYGCSNRAGGRSGGTPASMPVKSGTR